MSTEQVIANALTECERGFGYRVGQGQVKPGTFLTDADRAQAVLEALDAAGYDVVERVKDFVL